MAEFLTLAAAVALLTALAGLWRGWRGPAAMDRIMAVQLLGTSAIATMALLAFALDEPAILDAALVLALLAATASAAFVRFGSGKGEE
ncbi:monovalent cation/H+ antiporter complex subunit F [Roseococcus sp. YIM B11640]|uniref:monovalent cation/H+ antiporter complex subunit F n=1 Tax=Roseococcus sp. YIM B11640 TaxID=3133973 RepID=UPI003C7C30AF